MVSVIIPFHSDFALIQDVVNNYSSGLTKEDCEIIIVNDGSVSGDGKFCPLEIKKEYSFSPEIKIINNPIQRGVGYSFDMCVLQAIGDIICLSGADVFPREETWLEDVKDAVEVNPDALGCAASIGLQPNDYDLDKEGRNIRYGANLLPQVDVDDLPMSSKIREEDPDYRVIFEAQWRDGKYFNTPYEIPCALGAFYFTTKKFYQKMGGWDTSPNVLFQGHRYWGSLEPFISLKAWLSGDGVILHPDIEAGHVFAKIPKRDRFKFRAHRPQFHWWNRLWIAETMIFDKEIRDSLVNYGKPCLSYNTAKSYIRKNYNNILRQREKNKLGFINSFADICEKFEIKIRDL